MSAPATNVPPPVIPGDPRAVEVSPLKAMLTHSATLVFLVNLLLIAFFVALSPNHVFWSLANAESLLRNGAEILLLSLGVALLMGAGVFDLSATPAGGMSPTAYGLDSTFQQFQMVGEIEERHELWGQPGKVKVTAFLENGRMGAFADAIAFIQANPDADPGASINALRRP